METMKRIRLYLHQAIKDIEVMRFWLVLVVAIINASIVKEMDMLQAQIVSVRDRHTQEPVQELRMLMINNCN
jgi:hypothetical protein